ncbi:MAG: hypothetical protein P9M14_15715 [Candidatus Alcyoniella australis]|nr:hypothetical protein [Candidatus Alcyoniella australis]
MKKQYKLLSVVILAAIIILATQPALSKENTLTIKCTIDDDGELKCSYDGTSVKPGKYIIVVQSSEDKVRLSEAIYYELNRGDRVSGSDINGKATDGATNEIKIENLTLTEGVNYEIVVKAQIDKNKNNEDSIKIAVEESEESGGGKPSEGVKKTEEVENLSDDVCSCVEQQAIRWVITNGIDNESINNIWTGRKKVTLYFMPDGSPVKPIPSGLSEGDKIILELLLPADTLNENEAYELLDKKQLNYTHYLNIECPKKLLRRILGSFEAVKAIISSQSRAAAKENGGFKCPDNQIKFRTIELAKLDCGAGEVKITIDTVYGEKQQSSFKLSNVYCGTFGVQYVYDFTRGKTFLLHSDTTTNEEGEEVTTKTIRSDKETEGCSLIPAFIIHPAGLDENVNNWSFDRFSLIALLFNLGLGIDAEAPQDRFYVTDNLYFGGIYFTVGASVHKVNTLRGPHEEGDKFDGDEADLPVKYKWGDWDDSVDWVVGATIDVVTLAKMIGNATSKKSD